MQLAEAGIIWTDVKKCEPLDEIRIDFEWTGLNGQDVHIHVHDAEHRIYVEKTFASESGHARTTIRAGGKPGVHHIRVWVDLPDGTIYQRHGGFRVLTETNIQSDCDDINELFDQVREGLLQSVDVTKIDGKPVTHYKHGDNTRQNIAYPVYGFAGLRYFVRDMKTAFEALYDYQYPDGSLPDHIYGDNYPCPITTRRLRSSMADMETGAVSTIFWAWQAHGDDRWLAEFLPKMESGMDHVMTNPGTFDLKHGVIKRPHSLDEWDISFSPSGPGGDRPDENTVYVVMQGDTSGMFHACASLAEMYRAAHIEERAKHWQFMSEHFYRIGNELFWDGVKYRHHIHIDPFDHGDFDEDDQLTISNTFAINRGFADHDKAVSIINEYMRRLDTTGDRYPWWSLQPGYPDELGYFKGCNKWKRAQGHYANGGLFPWTGGELCRAALRHGKESVGVNMLKDYHQVVSRHDGAVFTWYDLQGEAHISSPHNQTNYDNWGYYSWSLALIEELAGIESQGKCFDRVTCSPRWPAAACRQVNATAHFPASDTYFRYNYRQLDDAIALSFAGTGKHASFHLLLPPDTTCTNVSIDGQDVAFTTEAIEDSNYVNIEAAIHGARQLICKLA
jgi:hypothetical protein